MSYKPIIDYVNIDAPDLLSLEQQVREMFHDNWQPLGGVAVSFDHRNTQFGYAGPIQPVYLQTMVKRGGKDD